VGGQQSRAETRIPQALGRNDQEVDLIDRERRLDRRPGMPVVGADAERPDTHAPGGDELIAHQGEQR